MAAIQNLCERVLLLQDGRLQRDGAPDDIIAKYLSGTRNDKTQNDLSKKCRVIKNYQAILKELVCVNATGQSCDSILAGESLELRLKYECSNNLKSPYLVSPL